MTIRIKVTLDPDNHYDRELINVLADEKNKAGALKYLATRGLKNQQVLQLPVQPPAPPIVQHIALAPVPKKHEPEEKPKEKPETNREPGKADFMVIGLDEFFKL